jgi:hypothetical protein
MARGHVRIGCSGWNYGSWRNEFYPPRTPASRWLEHYAVARWVEQTPPAPRNAATLQRLLAV